MRVQIWASLVTQLVKNLPAMQETWVRYPDWVQGEALAVSHFLGGEGSRKKLIEGGADVSESSLKGDRAAQDRAGRRAVEG